MRAFWFPDGFGIGIGTLVLVVNVVLLGGYVFGCHAFRHLIGGTFDQISDHPVRHKLYELRHLPELQPQEVGVGQPAVGGVFRYLRSPLLHGHLARLENPLDAGIPDGSLTTYW